MLCNYGYGKSRILIARQHFSMVILWRPLHRDFLRFANWTRTSGRRGNFYHIAQAQHPLLYTLSTAEKSPKSIRPIGGIHIFQGQHYSSCSKPGGCWAAQMLGGFHAWWEFANRQLGNTDAGMYSESTKLVQLIFQQIYADSRVFCAHSQSPWQRTNQQNLEIHAFAIYPCIYRPA